MGHHPCTLAPRLTLIEAFTSKNPMRILHIESSRNIGGQELRVVESELRFTGKGTEWYRGEVWYGRPPPSTGMEGDALKSTARYQG